MLRDGVCDEPANIAKCLYDGGDCCKEHKDRTLCLECDCILDINKEDLKKQFKSSEVVAIERIGAESWWTIIVEDVVSLFVCARVCLEHDNANEEVNAWNYLVGERICRCGWIPSTACPK